LIQPLAMTGTTHELSAESAASLTDRLARGDADALDTLYREWYPRLLALARRATGRDDAFAHDTVHDAFLRIIRTPARCTTDAQLSCWLRRCVLSAAVDSLRAEARRLAREKRHAAPELQHPHPADQLRWLAKQLGTLDPSDRELLRLRFVAEQSLHAIAQGAPGLTWSAVHSRLRRLLLTLRRRESEPLRPCSTAEPARPDPDHTPRNTP